MFQKYLSTKQLAERWGVSASAIQHGKAGSGDLTKYRLGKLLRFSVAEVETLEREMDRKYKKLMKAA